MKDPAVLIYFDKWISSTNGMRAEFRAWYFDLIIHQYDKGGIPTDVDELAGICRVRPSEYDSFKQMVEQVLKHKFELIDGKYHNRVIGEVLRKREEFKDKRERSGNIGVVIKQAKALSWCTDAMLMRLKDHLFSLDIKEVVKFKDNQVLEHLLKLYIDVDEDVNKDLDKGKGGMGEKPLRDSFEDPNITRHNSYMKQCLIDQVWKEAIFIQKVTFEKTIETDLKNYCTHLISQAENKASLKDFKSHFVNWKNKRNQDPKTQTSGKPKFSG